MPFFPLYLLLTSIFRLKHSIISAIYALPLVVFTVFAPLRIDHIITWDLQYVMVPLHVFVCMLAVFTTLLTVMSCFGFDSFVGIDSDDW